MKRLLAIASLLALGLLGSSHPAHAAVLTRGPYLQNVTSTSAILAWAQTPATSVMLEYGTTPAMGTQIPLGSAPQQAVTLTGLQPGTRYFYRIVLDGLPAAEGSQYAFHTAPLPGSGKPVEFLIWGDSGQGDAGQMQVAAVMNTQTPDFAIHVGDIIYPSGQRELYDPRYFQPYAPLLRRIPVWAALGNHDADIQAFDDFWYLPTNPIDGTEHFYSFDYGDIHFAVLNTSADLTTPILNWLDNDLRSTSRRWKMVFFHHPLYSCGDKHGSSAGKIATLGPIFDANDVDVVIYGHDHHYERTHPIRADSVLDASGGPDYVDPQGTIYVVSGGGGGERGTTGACPHTARALAIAHFVRASLDGDLLTLDAIDNRGQLIDRMTLLKTGGGATAAVDAQAPDGDESLEIGAETELRWSSTAGIASVRIELSRSGPAGPWETLFASTPNDGSETWLVSGPASADCWLRITDAANPATADTSAAPFDIHEPVNTDINLSINFQPTSAATPNGFLADTGKFFDPTRGYGWDRTVSTNERGANPDVLLDTYVEIVNPDEATWQLKVPSGDYRVSVVVGSPRYRGHHRIEVEGQRVIDDVRTSRSFHGVADVPIHVEDGYLTVRAGGIPTSSRKTKLCYLQIRTEGIPRPIQPDPFNSPPLVSVQATPSVGIAPQTVTFAATATDMDDVLLFHRWTFDDGSIFETPQVVRTYDVPGLYTGTITVTDPHGATATSTIQVDVRANQPPVVTATASPPAGIAPQTVAFTATGTDPEGEPLTYAWNFGDGSTAPGAVASHTYMLPGSYTATVTALDPRGALGTAQLTIDVQPNRPPAILTMTALPDTGRTPHTVQLQATGSDPEGEALTYTWWFEDGTSAAGATTSHTFTDVGTRTARLVLGDPRGAEAESTVTVEVLPNASPTATASALPDSGEAPLRVTLTATGNDPEGEALTFGWNFGDGTTASGDSLQHVYDGAGDYTATVTVTDPHGATGTASVAVHVDPPPGPLLAVNFQPSSAPVPEGYVMDSGSKFDATRGYGWDTRLSGRLRSTGDDPRTRTHLYERNPDVATWEVELPNGTYSLMLVVGDSDGSGRHRVEVQGVRIVDDVYTNDTVHRVEGHVFEVTDGRMRMTIGGISGTSKKTKVCYLEIYGGSGPFTPPGGGDPPPDPGPTNTPPALTLQATPTSGLAPLDVQLAARATDADGDPLTYLWDLGDGTSSTADSLLHTYATPGAFTARVTVRDSAGATATDSVTINVADPNGPTLMLAVNFQLASAPVPAGYVMDAGLYFDPTRGYGWDSRMSGRTRSVGDDPRTRTHLYERNPGIATWEAALPNGNYTLTLVVGDSDGSGRHRVEIQGQRVLDDVYTNDTVYELRDHPFTVTDGRLRMTIGGISGTIKKTKVCYLEIYGNGAPLVKPGTLASERLPRALGVHIAPNPANPSARIQLALPRTGHLEVDVFDVRGRFVRQLYGGEAAAGTLRLDWNGRDRHERAVTSGIYFVRIRHEGALLMRKLALVQ